MAACANLSKLGMDREINQPTTKMEEGLSRSKDEPFRVLEFYSGIGGMRYSIMKAGVNANIVEAFEINDIANDVYEYNFGHRPYQGNIQSLTAADLDSYCAHVWLLSPPCQPYTRQGLQKDSSDARAFSFLNILELIPKLSQAPMMLFVENVVGFETSDTHNKMIEVLAKAGYITQEFILTPLQFRVPYSRPRYFCLAKRKSTSFRNPQYNHQLLSVPSPLLGDDGDQILLDRLDEGWENLLMSCEPVERFLEFKCSDGKVERSSTDSVYSTLTERSDTMDLTIGSDGVSLDQYFVPLSLVEKLGTAMDIVYPDSRRCCCFTKSYYRYVKGTGSLLATVEPNVKGKSSSLKEQHLRYFTPREISNLHSFPREFCFPDHVSLRQRYALLGNSLSIAVVGPLLKYLIAEPS